MDNWVLKGPGLLEKEIQPESDISDNQIKVKVTHSLLSYYDVSLFSGQTEAACPVTLGRFATGVVTEAGPDCAGIRLSDKEPCRVFLNGVRGCGKCIACRRGKPEECLSPQIAGRDFDGFYRDIVVCEPKDVSVLPDCIDSASAVCIEFVAMAERAFDRMNLVPGSKVAIFGGGLLGMIMAVVAHYHKFIPVIIDFSAESLEFAKKHEMTYAFMEDDTLLDKVAEATSGSLCDGAVFVMTDKLNPLNAARVVAKKKPVVFAGLTVPPMSFDMREFMERDITIFSVTDGYGYIGSALNIIANGGIKLEIFGREIVTGADMAKLMDERMNESRPPNKLTILKMV
ncbi:MAG: alcohol dehydrogenase catalytic domain-containing protein [Clostridia bacterium]|nr:alcohol dehydrogenase catalytic domain-containing protein [Clostridia bacterium]